MSDQVSFAIGADASGPASEPLLQAISDFLDDQKT